MTSFTKFSPFVPAVKNLDFRITMNSSIKQTSMDSFVPVNFALCVWRPVVKSLPELVEELGMTERQLTGTSHKAFAQKTLRRLR